MDKRGGSSGRALQIVPVARERRQRAIFAQPMPQLGPRRQQIQHVADQNGRGLVASDQKQYAEPVCGELLISPESAIRHTHARGLPAGGSARGPIHDLGKFYEAMPVGGRASSARRQSRPSRHSTWWRCGTATWYIRADLLFDDSSEVSPEYVSFNQTRSYFRNRPDLI